MSYDEGFEITELDESLFSEAQRIVIGGFMLEGEFNFRERLIKILEKEILTEKAESSTDWTDGVSYCIHLIKNLKPEQN
jgi:hypothetical protein